MLNCIKSYLVGRSQYVLIIVVPPLQGLIMEFLRVVCWARFHFLYLSMILGFLPNLINKPKLFADDTNLFVNSPSLSDLQIKCQDSIDQISDWLLANKLTLNKANTCYMLFTPSISSNTCTELDLHINKYKINKVSSTKYLGVLIDENLDWKLHLSNLCLELRKLIGIFFINSALNCPYLFLELFTLPSFIRGSCMLLKCMQILTYHQWSRYDFFLTGKYPFLK